MLISIAIPTYRRASQLDRCLRSVLSQADPSIEILVNDNASPDNTPDIVAQYSADPRLSYVRNSKNLGMPGNMLATMERARGEWILILTDDDCLRAGAFSTIRQYIQQNPQAGLIISPVASTSIQSGHWKLQSVVGPDLDSRLMPAGSPRALNTAGRCCSILSRQIYRRNTIPMDRFRAAVKNAYFPCIWAADTALRHDIFYGNQTLIWHTVDNVQHWNEFGKNWREIYLRTHIDYANVMHDLFSSIGAKNAWRDVTWQTHAARDYGQLSVGLGPCGILMQRGPRIVIKAICRIRPHIIALLLLWTLVTCLRDSIRLIGSVRRTLATS